MDIFGGFEHHHEWVDIAGSGVEWSGWRVVVVGETGSVLVELLLDVVGGGSLVGALLPG